MRAMAAAVDDPPRTPLITVGAALRLPAIARGVPTVVAGERNLGRPVRWVHAGEVRNMASLLKGGEMLLTTGMGLQGDDNDRRRFVRELAQRGVAALVVELGSVFDAIPDAVVEEADEHGLPVVALNREVPFVEITQALHEEIVNRQFVVLRRADELHRRFTGLVLDGAGIPEVLESLAGAIANPVVLEKSDEGVLYHATHHAPSHDVLAAWDAVRQHGSSAPAALAVPIPTTGGETWGCLMALAVDSPLDELDRVALERAVGLISLALLRSRQEDLLIVRERGNFLGELMSGAASESVATARAAEVGFTRAARQLLPIVVRRAAGLATNVSGNEELAWALLWRDVRRELQASHVPAVAGTRPAERDMLLVIGFDDERQRAEHAGRTATILHAAAARHLGNADLAVVAVGPTQTSWTDVGQAFVEVAARAVAAAHGPARTWHDATRPDMHELLWGLRESPWLQRFVDRRLAALVAHDAERTSKLLPTLDAFCRHGGRKAETARALNVERQSLYHRLDRIEALIGESLSDEETLLSLHLALRAAPYVEGRGAPPTS